ncbi:MAG: protein kinase [Bacteroidales bacterium]|nr:protein kinase [Bacteroidales bacterium]
MTVPEGYKILGGGEGGSFAKVYKVRHIESGCVCAIRELKDTIVAKSEEELKKSSIYKKFRRETEVLRKLGSGSHPQIERINTFGTFRNPDNPSEHIAYWERNYIQGDNLKDYLDKNGDFVPVEEVIRLATQISSALAYCHEDAYCFLMNPQEDNLPDGCLVGDMVDDEEKRKELIDKYKVIHNDIHLKNILRRTDGNFLLIDFGMAIEGKDNPTPGRIHGGAAITRAPELWSDDSKTKPNEQTDIYSLGVVLYTWLAGEYPFPDDEKLMDAHRRTILTPTDLEITRKKHYEEKYQGQTYKRDYPQWLEDVILKCLKKDPKERFRNGKELYEYLLAHCNESYNVKYEVEIEQLTSKNDDLKSDNESLSTQLTEMHQTNASLNKQLNNAQNYLNHTQQTLRDVQEQLETLQQKLSKSRAPLWIMLTLFGLWGLGVSYYAWNNNPAEWKRQLEDKKQALTVATNEIDELKTIIKELQNEKQPQTPSVDNSAEITRLTNLISQKDKRIKELENQLSKQKPMDNSVEVTRLNNQIEQKNKRIKELENQLSKQKPVDNSAEITRLNNQIDQKNKRIKDLESIIEEKNKEIKALNNVIGGKTNK